VNEISNARIMVRQIQISNDELDRYIYLS
jgi:hypothetical protein